jgi:cytochrome c553
MKGETVWRNKTLARSWQSFPARLRVAVALALVFMTALAITSVVQSVAASAPARIPSYIAWTPETIATASRGDAFRGLLLAKRCEHCHGSEGFSPVGFTPNLAGLNDLAIWKQLEDFKDRKRSSPAMQPIGASLATRDEADLAAYYSKLPVYPDPQDDRVFPQTQIGDAHSAMASRLVTFGDGERGIPPCQACHGPIAYKTGAPSLATQNTDYVLNQLEAFANGTRANDINEPMRTIAVLLSEEERHALAEYYGAGFGLQPAGASGPPQAAMSESSYVYGY